jgi:LuxR family maltose regulon positive regulatory protein
MTSCKLVLEPLILVQILLAVALFKQKSVHQAVRLMSSLVRAAAPENLIRPLLDHGQTLAPLLALVLHMEKPAAETRRFVRTILRLTGHVQEARATLPKEYQALSIAASITQREQEILHLLAAGLTNSEMARQLSVSESTIKTHLAHLYAKLDVTNRVQALAQAHALELA